MARILVVDDEPAILSVLTALLKKEGHSPVPATNGQVALDLVKAGERFDLLLTDIRMSPVNGLELLDAMRRQSPDTPVILLTGCASVKTAVDAIKGGAFDYITKPFRMDELMIVVRRALEFHAVVAENRGLREKLSVEARFRLDNIVAESAPMRRVCDMVERIAPTDSTVLLIGESGTGKDVIARAIHSNSNRRAARYVPVNCAAMPEPLLESEMFGHVKGAFTGATSDKQGLFEAASGGTIFLDEIGAMPLSIQAKFLRVLQDKRIRKVGGTDDFPVDVRVIAATNDPLEKKIAERLFREDLYYRISVIPIKIPPLRERKEDVIPLVSCFLRRERPAGSPVPKIEPAVEHGMQLYDWPGNVRELENAVRHALAFMRGDTIAFDDLPARIVDAVMPAMKDGIANAPPDAFRGESLKGFLRSREKDYIKRVVDSMGGDKEKAAVALQISLTTLYRKLGGEDD